MHHVFEVLVAAHIMSGSIGLIAFWVPVIGRKGGASHVYWGRIFIQSMLITGALAIGISTATLIVAGAPASTTPLSTTLETRLSSRS